MSADVSGQEIRFALPGDRGSFVGGFDPERQRVSGHWIQPAPVQIGMQVASPVRLDPIGPNRWRGQVLPRASEYTFFLVIEKREDGSVGVFLRNPDRNLGLFRNLDRVVREGNDLEFIGTFFRDQEE